MLVCNDNDLDIINKKIEIALSNVERPSNKVTDVSLTDPEGFPHQTQVILDQIKDLPSMTDFEPWQIRKMRSDGGYPLDHKRDIGVRKKDFLIPGPQSKLPARIYTPYRDKKNKRKYGALVYFHGGGFSLGDIDAYDGVATQLADQSGLIVISVEYRLAPETPFPGGLMDAQHAFNWLYDHADKFQIDRRRMAIGGDSAGANLATVTCILNRDQNRPMPVFQMLIYPCTNGNNSSKSRDRLVDAPIVPRHVMEWMHDHYITKEHADNPRFNVLATKDLSALPPAFIMTAGYDPLLDEGEAYANRLKDSGVAVRYSCYTNMFHGFYNFGVFPESRLAINESAEILAKALR